MGSDTDLVSSLADSLLTTTGLDGTPDDLELHGAIGALPSSFRVEDGAAAHVVALHGAVRQLCERIDATACPTGPIVADRQLIADAFRSERLCVHTVEASLWDDWSGHFTTADGHVQFHTNFAHHRRAIGAVLELELDASRDDVAAATAEWAGDDLDSAVTEAGGISAVLRSLDEWSMHEHAGEQQNVVGVESFDTARRRWTGSMDSRRPLGGLRVVDCTRIIAGPVAARVLASLGADVLRIGAGHLPVVDAALPDTTLGKRFGHLDLRDAEARRRFADLIATADVIIDGYRPGALASHEFGRDEIRSFNPSIVHVDLSAFGMTGPWAGRRGFDSITQTATGIVDAETQVFGAASPRPLPCQFLDHGAGHLLALGTIAALTTSDGGAAVTTSLLAVRNWLVGLGRIEPPPASDLTGRWLDTRDSAFGPITHVKPVLATEQQWDVRWDVGPSRPGSDAPVWRQN